MPLGGRIMGEKNRLDGKKLLLVDDEPDVLDTLEDVLSMCKTTRAGSFQEARDLLESEYFDMAILDIMGVDGYKLLEISNRQKVSAVMLTAQALSPGHVKKSYREGAAFYVPKEEMSRLTLFLEDILEDLEKGKNPWRRWFGRMASFCERKFGPDWQKEDGDFWEKFPFY
jgi:DNA-binding NtrC family response regulator